ncbi:hypothetical protein ACV34S_22210 [Pseudomonas aeruginosa]
MIEQRSYQDLVDLCISLRPHAVWSNDMSRRSGEPALMSYALNAMTHLLIGRQIVSASYERSNDGLAVTPAAPAPTNELAPGGIALMCIRVLEKRLTSDGRWRDNLNELFPQLGATRLGEPVSVELAPLWLPNLLNKQWMREPAPMLETTAEPQAPEISDAAPRT